MEKDVFLNDLIEKIEEELYPQVVFAAQKALDAHDQDPDHFGNYTLGCAFWENLSNRLYEWCQNSSFFTATFNKNILEISATVQGKTINFYSPRVDEKSRVPCSGKRIKSILQQGQEFLSLELEALLGRCGVYTLGCDLDRASGLGKVTFDQLFPMGKGRYEAKTLATFGANEVQASSVTVQEEKAKKPAVRKEPIEMEARRQTK